MAKLKDMMNQLHQAMMAEIQRLCQIVEELRQELEKKEKEKKNESAK